MMKKYVKPALVVRAMPSRSNDGSAEKCLMLETMLTIASPDVTAIKTLPTTRNDKVDNSAIYSLTGQRVTDAKKGVYIVGGKKVVMK